MKFSKISDLMPTSRSATAQSEAEDWAKVEALRTAIQEGFESGIARGDVMGKLRGVIRERAKADS